MNSNEFNSLVDLFFYQAEKENPNTAFLEWLNPKNKKKYTWGETSESIQKLANVNNKKLLRCWEGLGYYSRARNLKKAAQMMLTEFGGKLPDKKEKLIKLPGVGHYTSSAIMAIVFNK